MGVVFSIILIAPSWGGMINGLLTLRGAWDKLREDPVLKFMVVGITFYGMSTFEGPMMAIKSINALTHYTDYTIGHVHSGALGWNGFIAFGLIYYLVPRLWKTEFWSKSLITAHFWTGTIGIVLYITAMWAAGITQGLMWRAITPEGLLKYPDFIETVTRLHIFYIGRLIGGSLYFVGTILMVVNFLKTIGLAKTNKADLSESINKAVAISNHEEDYSTHPTPWHRKIEGKPMIFAVCVLIAVFVGGPFEFVPLTLIHENVPKISSVKPYSALELEGRDIYIKEGCYNCHSQMIRPFRDEVLRYGEYSKAGEFVYDHPFQFGSKRTGPDLHRVGGKYPHFWHFNHMKEPTSTSAGSIMPKYPWLYEYKVDSENTYKKLKVMRALGVPYSDEEISKAKENLERQAANIVGELKAQGANVSEETSKTEIIALVAYLQRLGTDIKNK